MPRTRLLVALLPLCLGVASLPSSAQHGPPVGPIGARDAPGTLSISGRVVTSTGRFPEGLNVEMTHETEGLSSQGMATRWEADGSFAFGRLSPGTYVIEVKQEAEPIPHPQSDAEYGFAVVRLTDADVRDVTIRTKPGVTLTGVVRLERPGHDQQGGPPPCRERRPPVYTMRALLTALDETFMGAADTAAVNEDGTFTWYNLGGPRVIRMGGYIGGSCPPWRLEKVLLDSVDITDEPVDFAKRSHEQLTVVFSDVPQGMIVRALDARRSPVADVWIAVVSAEPDQREGWASTTATYPTDADGRAWFPLPVGDYLVNAVPRKGHPTVSSVLKSIAEHSDDARLVEVTPAAVARVQLTLPR